jgi:hypothetical protein
MSVFIPRFDDGVYIPRLDNGVYIPSFENGAQLLDSAFVAGGFNADVTTPAFDSTGATIIVVCVSAYNTVPVTIVDSEGNLYSLLTPQVATGTQPDAINTRLCYTLNPITNPLHTVTVSGTSSAVVAIVAAFNVASVFDGENGNNFAAVGSFSMQTGNVTPSANSALLVSGFGSQSLNNTIDDDFIIIHQIGGAFGIGALAYKVQSGAPVVENPTWTFLAPTSSARGNCCTLAAFIEAP